MMCDILYVSINHSLASQIYTLYHICYQLSFQEAPITPIDAAVSDGMNGFLFLCERNFYSITVPAPVKGLSRLENNQVLNATYLNPTYHQHIPEPPEGVIIPEKVLKPQDIKPFPVLWHEDNSSRHQAGRERSQLSVAASGPHLGAAAHRVLRNTLQLKANNSGLLERPYRNALQAVYKPRPTGPSGHKRSFVQDLNYYHCSNHKPRDFPNSRSVQNFNEAECSRQNIRVQERLNSQNQQQNIYVGMLNLRIEEQENCQQHPKMPDDEFWSNRQQPILNGPPLPSPPTNWIRRQPIRDPSDRA